MGPLVMHRAEGPHRGMWPLSVKPVGGPSNPLSQGTGNP